MTPTPNEHTVATLQHATTAIAAVQDALGAVQGQMAGTVDAHLGAMKAAVQGVKKSLVRRTNAAVKHQSNLTGGIVGGMGATVQSATSAVQQQQTTIAKAAVGMPTTTAADSVPSSAGAEPPSGPASLPAGSGAPTGATTAPPPAAPVLPTFYVYYSCSDQHPWLVSDDANDQILIGQGYKRDTSVAFGDTAAANYWITQFGGQRLTDLCGAGGATTGGTTTSDSGSGGSATGNYLISIGWDGCNYGWVIASSTGAPVLPDAKDAQIVAASSVGQISLSGVWTHDTIDTAVQQWLTTQDLQHNPSCAGASGVLPPPPPPPPPPPTCPVPQLPRPALTSCGISLPDVVCPFLVNGQLPAVGSAEWCQCLGALASWLDSVGQSVAGWIDDSLKPTQGDQSDVGIGAILLGMAGVDAGSIASMVVQGGPEAMNRLACLWDTLRQQILKLGVEAGAKILGLTLARTLLTALHRLRIGWDGLVWATVDLEVVTGPLEKLLDYVENWSFQWEIPAVSEAIDCYLQHTAPADQVKCWMAVHGANFDIYSPVIDARREKLRTEEVIEYVRRNGGDDGQAIAALMRQGWYRESEATARVALYDQLPSVNDVLHFLQRNVFDAQYVADYGLLDGYQERFYPRYGAGLRALGITDQVMQDHYAAHWINPAIGQLAEMMIRLRPGRVDPTIQFTLNDFNRVLAEQDVAPFFRQRLAAIALRTFPLRQLNQATQQGRFGRDELIQRWMDNGFSQDNATILADTYLVNANRSVESQIHGYTPAFIADLAEWGLIDEDFANLHLKPQGYTAQQVSTLFAAARARKLVNDRKKHDEQTVNDYAKLALSAYEDGVIDRANALGALGNANYSDDAATLALDTIDLRVQKATIDLAVKAIHKAYNYGAVDAIGALSALTAAGVMLPMANTLVRRWQLERSVPRISAASAAVLRWAKKGIMSIANARARLLNLGWGEGDIELQLAEVQQAIDQAQQLAASKRARALAQAQKQAQAAIRSAQKQSCRIYTPGKMVRWYALRIIDDDTFRARLQQCGYSDADIAGLLEEASVARQAKDTKAAKSGASGIQYTGPGSASNGTPAPTG